MGCYHPSKIFRYRSVGMENVSCYSHYSHPKKELLSSMLQPNKRWLIIDTDVTIDGALAILIAIQHQLVGKILAITCTNGNVTVDQASENAAYVLNLCNCYDVPIYKGANSPIIDKLSINTALNVGDGLGDIEDRFDSREFYNKVAQTDNAVEIMISLVNRYEGKISLITLGPLTNLALACKINLSFPNKLKDLTILGGNYHSGLGESSCIKEKNFLADPEAASIVFDAFSMACPVRVITGQTVIHHSINFQWINEIWLRTDSNKSRFVEKIVSQLLKFYRQKQTTGYYVFDALAIAVAIDPSIILEAVQVEVEVELMNPQSRGYLTFNVEDCANDRTLQIVRKIDIAILKEILWNATV